MTARAALLLTAFLTACASAPPGPPSPPGPEADRYPKTAYWEAFLLPLGGSAVFPDGLVVTFEDVPQDSRCPRNVQCIHAGSATVRLTVWNAAGKVDSLALVTLGPGSRGRAFGVEIELRRLLPEPIDTVVIAKADYTAALVAGKY